MCFRKRPFEFKKKINNHQYEVTFIARNGNQFMKGFINGDDEWLKEIFLDKEGMYLQWLKDVEELEIYYLILNVKNDYRIQYLDDKVNKIRQKLNQDIPPKTVDVKSFINIYLNEYGTSRQENINKQIETIRQELKKLQKKLFKTTIPLLTHKDIEQNIRNLRQECEKLRQKILSEKINKIRQKFKKRLYLKTIDINQLIETYLKEYENLRQEILFYMQNRTQMILLGLTGIFAIAGLAITPLANFLTEEKININVPIENSNVPDIITRATDGCTIYHQAIYPPVIIFAIIIPIFCTYIVYRNLEMNKQINNIGYYIENNIEKKIQNLNKDKLENQIYFSQIKDSLDDSYEYFWKTPNWEKYFRENLKKNTFQSDKTILIMVTMFYAIAFISLLGSSYLLTWDFNCEHISFNNINTKKFWWFFYGLWVTIATLSNTRILLALKKRKKIKSKWIQILAKINSLYILWTCLMIFMIIVIFIVIENDYYFNIISMFKSLVYFW